MKHDRPGQRVGVARGRPGGAGGERNGRLDNGGSGSFSRRRIIKSAQGRAVLISHVRG